MKKQKKKYSKPKRPYDKERIEREKKILHDYGLRRKHEIWRAEGILRNLRARARKLAARKNEKQEKLLLGRLQKLGLIKEAANLDDVLTLTTENILDRRLQTLVYKKGLANTLKQARQFIVHGHVALNGRKVTWPSMLIKSEDEKKINFYEKSKVKETKLKELKGEKVEKPTKETV